jgi:predicted secreted protein
MNPAGAIVSFLIIWWTVFFCMLPIGVQSQAEAGTVVPGTDPGAPVKPDLWRKALWTTLVAGGLWGLLFLAVAFDLVSLEMFAPPPSPTP